MSKRKPYDVCPNCGAHLDHGECCDCETRRFVEEEAAKRGMHLEQWQENPTRYFLVRADGTKISGLPYKMTVWRDEFRPVEIIEYDPELWREGINNLLDNLNTWQLQYVYGLIQGIWISGEKSKPRATVPHLFAKELQPGRIYRKVDRKA